MQLNGLDNAGNARSPVGLEVADLISSFARYYPDIDDWFASKVIPGLVDGTRRMLVLREFGSIQGLAILKKVASERKICTLWVRPDQRKRGIGQLLVNQSVTWLECKKPMLTVPEEANSEFEGLLTKNGFELRQRAFGYYRSDVCEFVYNGALAKTLAGTIIH